MKTPSLPLSMHTLAHSGLLGRRSPFATLEAVHFSQANHPLSFTASAWAGSAQAHTSAVKQSPKRHDASFISDSLLGVAYRYPLDAHRRWWLAAVHTWIGTLCRGTVCRRPGASQPAQMGL